MRKEITIIAAIGKNHELGKDNDLPWHIPDDLKYFKAQTLDTTVIMGRKTFESVGSKPLPNRQNIVITRDTNFDHPLVEVVNSLEAAINLARHKVMIIGGGEIYKQSIEIAHNLLITHVDLAVPNADCHFPYINECWQKQKEDKRDGFSFTEYKRIMW